MGASKVKDAARALPGIAAAGAATLISWGIHLQVPEAPILTICVALGVVLAQLPGTQGLIRGVFSRGFDVTSTWLLRIGIVVLGLQLSMDVLANLGWSVLVSTVIVAIVGFGAAFGLGRLLRMPGNEPLLLATGISVGGSFAAGAMSGMIGARRREASHPMAVVTLFGAIAMFAVPALQQLIALTDTQFGPFVGMNVPSVGAAAAATQFAGGSAVAIAVALLLLRTLMLTPMLAVARARERGQGRPGPRSHTAPLATTLIVIAGFALAVALRSMVALPDAVLQAADVAQTALLGMALFALGTAVDIRRLVATGGRGLVAGLLAWALMAALAFGAVQLV